MNGRFASGVRVLVVLIIQRVVRRVVCAAIGRNRAGPLWISPEFTG
jgi:hypothetical protein